MNVDDDHRPGTLLKGKWRLLERLGSGGMGSVYVAEHLIGHREAIKILHPDAAHDPEIRERFKREALAVNRFSHPGVVQIRDIDETEDGCPFLVMELLEGESLSERIRHHGYPTLPEVLEIAAQLLDVLAAAHQHGVIHRDIKPANLFWLPDGRLKVLDFGVAQMQQQDQLTRMGTRLGTVAYMAPEQCRGESIDARADLFSVGATMFRLIARRHVHEAESSHDLATKMATTPAPALASVAPDPPPDVCQVVDRALQFDPAQRYPHTPAMREDVRALIEGRTPPFAGASAQHTVAQVAAPLPAPAAPEKPPAPPAAAVPAASPPATPSMPTEASSVLTRFTEWTQVTPETRRTRRFLLAFPILGLLVAVGVFQLVVHCGAAPGPEPEADSLAAATGGSHAAGPSPAEPPPDLPAPASANCALNDTCQWMCEDRCRHECPGGRCQIGLLDGAKLDCRGEGQCEVWCAGECEVRCEYAPCRVHCAAGQDCEIDDCRGEVRACPDQTSTCGMTCDGEVTFTPRKTRKRRKKGKGRGKGRGKGKRR